jgi:hypothetical protein
VKSAGTTATHQAPQFSIRLGEDGIARMVWAPHSDITLDLARACDAALVQLCGGQRGPLLVELDNVRSVDRDARTYFASSSTVTAVAMVGRSPLAVAIGNFFIRLAHPVNPTGLFSTEAEAVDWLKGFIK